MRIVATTLVGVSFILIFVMANLSASVAKIIETDKILIEATRAANTRSRLVSFLSLRTHEQIALSYKFKDLSEEQIRQAIGKVIDDEWFEKTLRELHASARTALLDGKDATFDLTGLKAKVRTAADSLADKASHECEKVWGPEVCKDQAEAKLARQFLKSQVNANLARWPDSVDLATQLEKPQLKPIGERLLDLRTWKWVARALLVIGGLLTVWVGGRRGLTALGITLVVAMVAYVIVAPKVRQSGRTQVAKQLEKQMSPMTDSDAMLRTGVSDLAAETINHSIDTWRAPVVGAGVLGFGLLLFGQFQARKRN